MEDSSEEEPQACWGLWRRLGARGACARLRRRRVAPDTDQRSPRSRKSRINHPPKAQYSALGERVRVSTPAALQCALFCGGARCPYERAATGAIQGLYSDWITDDILAMARPSSAAIAARNIVQQFHSWGIRTVINLQTPGEHASCGPALTSSGFTYDPNIFMANDIYYYNFAWPDYGEASLSGLLDMAKVLSFALQEGRVAIHCHAALIALKVWLEPIKGVCRCKTKLYGKVALVTGGNSGIGLETAKDLAKRGARVIIASRDNKKSVEAVNLIKRITRNDAVEYRHLDLSKYKSIRRFCEEFNATVDRLDILVNNAGCGGVKQRVTEDGIDLVTQINYLGPFLLTNLLMKKLTESKPSRVVIVASYAGHFAKLDTDDISNLKSKGYWAKYCNTKLCNILWAKALEKKLPKGVTANSLHPGLVKTAIFDRIPARIRRILLLMIEVMFKSAKEGAQTSIHLCVAPELENTSGKYYSDCKPARIPREAKDEAIIDKVWRESIRLTGS